MGRKREKIHGQHDNVWGAVDASKKSKRKDGDEGRDGGPEINIQLNGSFFTFDPFKQKQPDLPTSTRATPLLGWRYWKLYVPRSGDARLRSFTASFVQWPREGIRGAPPVNSFTHGVSIWGQGDRSQWGVFTFRSLEEMASQNKFGQFNAPPHMYYSLIVGGYHSIKDDEVEEKETGIIRQRPDPMTQPPVWGVVQCWGKVVMHERGYRAQKAKPFSLTLRHDLAEYADTLREFYDVPVRVAEPNKWS